MTVETKTKVITLTIQKRIETVLSKNQYVKQVPENPEKMCGWLKIAESF